jgi:hypothetical protein
VLAIEEVDFHLMFQKVGVYSVERSVGALQCHYESLKYVFEFGRQKYLHYELLILEHSNHGAILERTDCFTGG